MEVANAITKRESNLYLTIIILSGIIFFIFGHVSLLKMVFKRILDIEEIPKDGTLPGNDYY